MNFKNITLIILISLNSFSMTTVKSVEQIVKDYKKAILINNEDLSLSSEKLTKDIIENKITLTELNAYVRDNASLEEYLKFNEIMNYTFDELSMSDEIEPEIISEVLGNALLRTETSGSNFISCTTGRAIGIPLIIISAALSITSIALSTISKGKIQEKFQGYKVQDTEGHLNNIADLEFEEVTYEADIIYYHDEIDELNRRIDSGLYTDIEVEEYQSLIIEYNKKILDSKNLIEEVKSDIEYYNDQFIQAEQERIADEKDALIKADKKIKAGKIMSVPAIVTGLAGSVVLAIGNQDCN